MRIVGREQQEVVKRKTALINNNSRIRTTKQAKQSGSRSGSRSEAKQIRLPIFNLQRVKGRTNSISLLHLLHPPRRLHDCR